MKYFDGHRRLSQSEECECIRIHDKDGVTREFLKGTTRGLREEHIIYYSARLRWTKQQQNRDMLYLLRIL